MKDEFSESAAELAAQMGRVLGHPLRVRIVSSLMHSNASASMLARAYDVNLAGVSYHLGRVLYDQYKVVEVVETHQRRGAQETVYRLRRTPAVSFMMMAVAALDTKGKRPGGGGRNGNGWKAVAVDARGEAEIESAVQAVAETAAAVARRCAGSVDGDARHLLVNAAAIEITAPKPKPGR